MNRLSAFVLLLISLPVTGAVVVEWTGIATDAEKTRLTFHTTASVSHQVFTLDAPDRAIVDIADATLSGKLPAATTQHPMLIGLRSGVRNRADLRIVLDLKQAVRIKSFSARAEQGRGQQLIFDLIPLDRSAASADPGRWTLKSLSANVRTVAMTGDAHTALIAIDAGHGGEDPGAIGPTGTREKDVTLAIARKLASLIEKEPGMRVLMIRDGDTFVGLRQRILKAQERHADLFVSLHADAFDNTEAHGSSVYTLSNAGASSESASLLAERENSADRVGGGVDISASDELLANVLMDLTQNATIEHSTEIAVEVLAALGKVGELHRADVQRAGFVVLKSPDIPSLLVETAFISNAAEERRLKSAAHQQRLAQAIFAGIGAYLKKFPPGGSQFVATDSAPRAVAAPPERSRSMTQRAPPERSRSMTQRAPPERSRSMAQREPPERSRSMAQRAPPVAPTMTSPKPKSNKTKAVQPGAVAPAARARQRGSREYVINAGDTLSGIAQRHQVSLSSLRAKNGLEEDDLIRAGQILAIPAGS